ncbi:oxidoreductase [Deltaproteobacteria bacterium]|nr:oxidoreductase [Deltaproteobacteria bacterium]
MQPLGMSAYDVIIIGAGPAGSTLARLVGRERSVLLLDARSMSAAPSPGFGEEKCCGGLLAPDARMWFEKQNLRVPASVLDSSQPLAVRAVDLPSGLEKRYPRQYLNLKRRAFEVWLLSLVPQSVERCFSERCVAVSPLSGGGWRVIGKSAHGVREYSGAFLVGADGAGSLVRRALGEKPRKDALYLAIQDSFALPEGGDAGKNAEYAALFDASLTDFYAWLIPKHDQLLLGAAFPLKRVGGETSTGRMESLRSAVRRRGVTLGEKQERRFCLLLRPTTRDVFLGKNGAFCIGEAAGWISPSSAEGFSYAFASATAMASALLARKNALSVLAAYQRNTLRLALNIRWKELKSRVMFSPALRRLIMRSNLLARE